MKSIKILLLGLAIGAPTVQANLATYGGFEQPVKLAETHGYQYLRNNNTGASGLTSISNKVGEESYLMNKNRSNGGYIARVYQDTYGLAQNTGNTLQTSIALAAGITYYLSFVARANVAGALPLNVSIGESTSSFANTTTFNPFQYQFTATATDIATTLKFFNSSANGGNRIWNLDAVNLQPVPLKAEFANPKG
ncbi:MAG: hypothetical protein RIR39_1906 [Pseudomonadota bacterium]|jgi:hypothetical protein